MNFEIIAASKIEDSLKTIFIEMGFASFQVAVSSKTVLSFFEDIKDEVYIGIEYPYVDRLYRNSYYYYYSSKFKKYNRDCVRLSFFDCSVTITDFFSPEKAAMLQEHFLGILVLRPTPGNVIGRNFLRPDIFKKKADILVSISQGNFAVNGLKLNVVGFPHSSQDSEMNVCAETALWSILEYFSHRYHEYRPLLPGKIQKIVAERSNARQQPSPGLNILDMSYVLKRSGFGVKWYSNKEPEFQNLIKIYIESGIPVMAVVNNSKGTVHVMNLIGRTKFISQPGAFTSIFKFADGSHLYDFYELPAKYLVIDDNLRPYKEMVLSDPCEINYKNSPQFKGCVITGLIVPLSHKIYMEADKAKAFAIQLLAQFDKIHPIKSHLMRVLLASSRSYKYYITQNLDMDTQVKTLLINTAMPKFIWIIELIPIDTPLENKASGVMILDATEPRRAEMLAYLINGLYFGTINQKTGVYNIPLPAFTIFNNLNSF